MQSVQPRPRTSRPHAQVLSFRHNFEPGPEPNFFMNDITPVPYEHIVFTDFDGNEGILVDLNTKKYYQLNETAMLIWKGIEKRLPPAKIAEEIVSNYEVTLDDAARNVEKTLQDFAAHKLIVIE
jgi:Coenzyme PQQ synthesis protein D (PqqD)